MGSLHPRIDPVMTMPAKAALTMLAEKYEIIRAGSWKVKRTFVVQGFILVHRADTDDQFHDHLIAGCFERLSKQPEKLSLAVMLCIIGPGSEGADKEASKYGRIIDLFMHLKLSPAAAWKMMNDKGIVNLAKLAAALIPLKTKRVATGGGEANIRDQQADEPPNFDAPVDDDGASPPQEELPAGPCAGEAGDADLQPADSEFENDEADEGQSGLRAVLRCTGSLMRRFRERPEGTMTLQYKLRYLGLVNLELELSLTDAAASDKAPTL